MPDNNDQNSEYWKELFGEDYDDRISDILKTPPPVLKSEPVTAPLLKQEIGPIKPGKSDASPKFHTFELNPETKQYEEKTEVVPNRVGRYTIDTGDKNFDIDFDFDSEYSDAAEELPLRQRRERRTGLLGGLLFTIFIIAVSLLLASLAWLAATDVLGLGASDASVVVTIPDEFDLDTVSGLLYENELINYEFLFKWYVNFSDKFDLISAGTYSLSQSYDYRMLVNSMTPKGGARVEVEVTIPEGYTLAQIFSQFEKSGVCSEDKLWNAAKDHEFEYDFLKDIPLGDRYRLEGYLFPDTYKFYIGDTPERAINKLLSTFKSKWKDEYTARAAELGYTVDEIITIASMIEKEAGNGDSKKIASVIYNRLNSSEFPHLQIDATIYYAREILGVTGTPFSRDLDSPYNTDVCIGLPISPISNPGIRSIEAALYPEDTNYYFYALGKEGAHEFFNKASDFDAFINSDQYGG